MSNRVGIMHGRLSEPSDQKIQEFPRYTWRYEFEKAKSCGFELIEWIFDTYDQNPIMNDDGIREVKNFSANSGIVVNSVLADFFMENKLVSVSESTLEKNMKILKILIKNSNKIGAKILEIPFVDSSSLTTREEQLQIKSNLETILPLLEEYDIILTLETDLPPNQFKELLSSFTHPNIRANYDVGNSAALGYDMTEEFNAYGNLINNVHIKDRKLHGHTVPLGSGDANFELLFSSLRKIKYDGDFIIQGARELGTNPADTCAKYLRFVNKYVEKYLLHDVSKEEERKQ